MIQKYSRYRILQEFFDFPRKEWYMRELSRRVKIAYPSVVNHLKFLEKDGFIIKEKKGIYPIFRANRDSEKFKVYKKTNILLRVYESGLIDYLNDSCFPSSIILFGSASKGEDVEESDIDIFIEADAKKLVLVKYEKLLNRKINLFFEPNFKRLANELKNNLLNGIVLKGYIKVY